MQHFRTESSLSPASFVDLSEQDFRELVRPEHSGNLSGHHASGDLLRFGQGQSASPVPKWPKYGIAEGLGVFVEPPRRCRQNLSETAGRPFKSSSAMRCSVPWRGRIPCAPIGVAAKAQASNRPCRRQHRAHAAPGLGRLSTGPANGRRRRKSAAAARRLAFGRRARLSDTPSSFSEPPRIPGIACVPDVETGLRRRSKFPLWPTDANIVVAPLGFCAERKPARSI